jgi:hypothetical protein
MSAEFGLRGYRALLAAFQTRGYAVRGFDDAEPTERHLILRHDIDYSLDAAIPVAEIERDLGVRAAYFVLMRSEFYNPMAPDSARAIARLGALGHETGLHFDAALYEKDAGTLDDAAARECAVLENLTGAPVRTISFHRPAPALLGREGHLAGRRHTYEPRYFSHMGYCSDSRGGWHRGAPLDHPAIIEGRALQLLTHPIWWQDPPMAPAARLTQFLEERAARLDREMAAHSAVHAERKGPPT